MAVTIRFSAGAGNTGLVIGDLTIIARTDADVAMDQAGKTLTEATGIPGQYALALPSANGPGSVLVKKTVGGLVLFQGVVEAFPVILANGTTGANALCTLAEAKAATKLTGTTAHDDELTKIVLAATDIIEGEFRVGIIARDYAEDFSPAWRDDRVFAGLNGLRPRQFPIISVTSLHEDSARAFGASTLIAAAGYVVTRYTIELLYDGVPAVFSPGQRSVRLAYRAGYETIPADITRLALAVVKELYRRWDKQTAELQSESMGGVTVTYRDFDIKDLMKKLGGYGRYYRPPGW